MKLTAWFPPSVKPVRPGVYETQFMNENNQFGPSGFSRWTGNHWTDTCTTIQGANINTSHGLQNKKWRGIKK